MKRYLFPLAFFILIAAGYGLFHHTYLRTRPVQFTIEIHRGETLTEIARKLEAEGVVPYALVFRLGARLFGVERSIQAGYYEIHGKYNLKEILHLLTTGRDRMVQVTIPEGLTAFETFDILVRNGLGDRQEYLFWFERPQGLVPDGFGTPASLEGFLFPETYRFPESADERDVIRIMVEQFTRNFAKAKRNSTSEGNYSDYEILTLASLVEKETAVPEERPLIASVFHNRLRKGMRMDCDPTVIYALMLEGRWDGNIRRSDLSMKHAYNTYVYRGLPPGPIASPGLRAMEAAFHPAATDFLFFVSRNDGTHDFSETYSEHERKVKKYQVQYWRRKWRNR